MIRPFLTILVFLLLVGKAFSQHKGLKVSSLQSDIRIDGLLDEEAWSKADIATDFITNSPVFGKPSARKTEVRVLYDNTAIYIGAFLYEDPALIRKQFTARDQERQADADNFSVFIDTYKDRQNAYQFLVTSRNVQSDARISPNAPTGFGIYGDLSWDAVWDSKVSFHANGWAVEMRIPYFSIRFTKMEFQEWGIQFQRFSRRMNETSFWNPVDPNVNGFVNQFGDLSGINNIKSPLRLSLSPYLSGGYRSTPQISSPYQNEWLKSGGMDIKYGISESFTLDATLIPDFGQVISDNVVNNISPFEVQFQENRPFFTEGTELYNKAGIFYSRRVGRTPEQFEYVNDLIKDPDYNKFDIIKNPSITRLYNALKFSGRTASNLGIGLFNAVGRKERAIIRNRVTGQDSMIVTEELTNYNVFVLDQALKNRSYLTLTNTNVLRNGHSPDANVTALDIALYDKTNRFGFFLRPRYSRIFDYNGSYEGYSNHIEFGKISGKMQYTLSNSVVSPKYSPNDLGFLLSPNNITNHGDISYNIFQPSKYFLNQRYTIRADHSLLYKPTEFAQFKVEAESFWIFRNFWDLTITAGTAPFWYNDFFELQTPASILETPRQKLRRSPYYFIFVNGSSDSRKRLFAKWTFGGAEGPLPKDPYYRLLFGLRYRFSDRFSLEATFQKQYDNGQFGYAFSRDPMNGAPLLARRQYTDASTLVTGIYNFTSRMNLTMRARHYWNRLDNTNIYNVKDDGNWVERMDLVPTDYNDNYNAFNLDVFYTWDFRLGSRIILGWKNWLGLDYERAIAGNSHTNYFSNAGKSLQTPHGNEVTLRFIYFLDYLSIKRK